MKKRSLIAVAAALLLAQPAAAHDDHLSGAQHGGRIVESGHHHLEVVVRDGELDIYVTGTDGTPEATADAKGTAVILSGGRKSEVALVSGDGNALKGRGDFTAAEGTVIVVTLTMPGHEPEQSRLRLD